ncbi:MAG: hypothetical protein IKZ07_00505 [Akkermansia sp.]|nr:hypothetical protein [Akkermansia sp.]
MTAILASTDWLRHSPHAALWIICAILVPATACFMLINDEENRHACVAFGIALIACLLFFILVLNTLNLSLSDLINNRPRLLGYGRSKWPLNLLILIWLSAAYCLSRGIIHLFHRLSDRRGDDEDDTDTPNE